jgi:gliding-associated putative ABC transporter substrate-binding component GldG
MKQRLKIQSESLIFLLIILGIIILINFISVRVFFRIDLTEKKIHSLSEGSKRLMRNLDDRLTIKAFFTEDLPPPFNAHARYLRDLLEEYKAYSKGNLKFEFIDPMKDPDKEKQANELGVHKVRHQVIKKDQATWKYGYRGVAFTYHGKTLAISMIQDTIGLEYEITNILKRLLGEKKTIGFLQGHDEPTFSKGLSIAYQNLSHYNLKEVNLDQGKKDIDKDIDALVIVGPKKPLSEKEKFRIDQFLMKGKAVAFFVDGVKIDTSIPFLSGQVNETGLRDLLIHYGVSLKPDLVLDVQCERITVPWQRGIPLAVQYPPVPAVTDLKKDHPIAFRLKKISMPWASSLTLTKEVKKDKNIKAIVLARSSIKSWSQKHTFNLDPFQKWKIGPNQGPFIMAVALSGRFESFYKKRPSPLSKSDSVEETPIMSTPDGGTSSLSDYRQGVIQETISPARIVVVGDSDIVQDRAMISPSNQAFFFNTLDWLTQEEDLIAIRAKQAEVPPLKPIESEAKKALIKYLNIFLWPILFSCFGLIRWRLRIKRRKIISLK